MKRTTATRAICIASIASCAQSKSLHRIPFKLKLPGQSLLRHIYPVNSTGALAAKGIELPGSYGISVRCALLQLHKLTQGGCVYEAGCLSPAISLLHMSPLPCKQVYALSYELPPLQ